MALIGSGFAETLDCEVLVVGSGPGGATTAALLAEAGRSVILCEEGSNLPVESAPSYSLEEMNQKYRNGGLTPAFGKTNVTYIEGRCVGGASEINAALYHRPIAETLKEWQLKYQIDHFGARELEPYFSEIEQEMVAFRPDGLGPASDRLRSGADKLGWKANEIARFWKYSKNKDGTWSGRRQSMTETLIPRALRAGCQLLADTRVLKLEVEEGTAKYAVAEQTVGGQKRRIQIRFKHVFSCAGAVHSPAMLRRSGLTHNIGDTLQLHPMVRVAARFRDPVNDPSFGVPVLQVEEFKPHLTLGCSHSSLPHLALWLAGDVPNKKKMLDEWQYMTVFYAAVTGSGRGKIRNLPGFAAPLVSYPINDKDMALLGEGLYRLGQLVFSAGAVELVNPIEGGPSITSPRELERIRTGLPYGKVNITTIHLFSSCPMGADPRQCATDSYGKVHSATNVYINDASLLPSSPGVNPQGTILAIARRNVRRFLEQNR